MHRRSLILPAPVPLLLFFDDRVSDGCAFAIHDPNVYMTEIAPRFFHKQTHLRSFHRQLSIWVSFYRRCRFDYFSLSCLVYTSNICYCPVDTYYYHIITLSHPIGIYPPRNRSRGEGCMVPQVLHPVQAGIDCPHQACTRKAEQSN